MKRPTKQLADDLLEDSVSPEFRAALLHKTLHSVRKRKRARNFNLGLGITALVGIFALIFWGMRGTAIAPNSSNQLVLSSAPLSAPNSLEVVTTKQSSILTRVQTSDLDRPSEINDKQLMLLLADKPVALVRYAPNQTELISFVANN